MPQGLDGAALGCNHQTSLIFFTPASILRLNALDARLEREVCILDCAS